MHISKLHKTNVGTTNAKQLQVNQLKLVKI